MVNKKFIILQILVLGLSSALIKAGNPLNPGAPVAITNDTSIYQPIVLASNVNGFMSVATEDDNLAPSFSTTLGASWINRTPNFLNEYLLIWGSGNTLGFMVTWVGPDIGYVTYNPNWIFSKDNGATWGDPGSILAVPSSTVYAPVTVCGTAAGFMAGWRDGADNDVFTSFATTDDGGTSWAWGDPVNISNSGTVHSPVMIAGTEAGFMAVWPDFDQHGWSSFSSDNGSTWSTPSSVTLNSFADMWVAGNSTGFMVTWVDSDNNAYSSFSSDHGDTWGAQQFITNNMLVLDGPVFTDVSITASETGFVVAWIGADNNAYGSFTTGTGDYTWSEAVQITDDGSVIVGNIAENGNGCGFMSVNLFGNDCIFGWLGSDYNTYSSYARLGGSVQPPSFLTGVQLKNDFGLQYEYYNQLNWALSSTTEAVGYHVYRNGTLIGTVDGSATSYQDHNQLPGVLLNAQLS